MNLEYAVGYEEAVKEISKVMNEALLMCERDAEKTYLDVVNALIVRLHSMELNISIMHEQLDEQMELMQREFEQHTFFGTEWVEATADFIHDTVPDDVKEVTITLTRPSKEEE